MARSQDQSAFDVARESDERVNEMLAETDGAIASMAYDGEIGYHIHVAKGETSPEYLWKVALFQAFDDMALEMTYVDADTPEEARWQLEDTLQDTFSPFVADAVADEFESNLEQLMDVQRDRSGE